MHLVYEVVLESSVYKDSVVKVSYEFILAYHYYMKLKINVDGKFKKYLVKSKKYLDSIDAKNNKFKSLNILTGYSHDNSFENNE